MYLRSVTFKGKPKKSDPGKLCVTTLQMQPFDATLAQEFAPGIRPKLFSRDGQPVEEILNIEIGLHTTHVMLVKFHMAPDTRACIGLDTVEIGRRMKIRRDKETPQYAATLTLIHDYPAAKDLLALVQNINAQYFVSIEEQEPLLTAEEDDEDEDGEDDDGFDDDRRRAGADAR